MNYPKKDEYNAVKRLAKKDRNTIGKLEEFLDFRFKYYPPRLIMFSDFFVSLFTYYGIDDLANTPYKYYYMNFCSFISIERTKILKLKECLNIKDFYLYRYSDSYGMCRDDLAGILFKNKQQKMIFLLKHAEIVDTILK